jgi:hypothetical protein
MYVGTRSRGLGATPGQITQTGLSLASPVGAAVGGGVLATATGLAASLAVPLVGAAIAGVTILVTKLIQNSGCGPTCVQASDYANQAEPLLRQNLYAYFSQPKPRSQSSQAAALANYDAIWNQAVKLWSDPALGNAGKRGISDRQAGACTWKQNVTYAQDIMAAGEPQIGQCWNWDSGYRAPIANDPSVVPDAQAALSGSAGSVFPAGSGVSLGTLALVAVLVLAGAYLL